MASLELHHQGTAPPLAVAWVEGLAHGGGFIVQSSPVRQYVDIENTSMSKAEGWEDLLVDVMHAHGAGCYRLATPAGGKRQYSKAWRVSASAPASGPPACPTCALLKSTNTWLSSEYRELLKTVNTGMTSHTNAISSCYGSLAAISTNARSLDAQPQTPLQKAQAAAYTKVSDLVEVAIGEAGERHTKSKSTKTAPPPDADGTVSMRATLITALGDDRARTLARGDKDLMMLYMSVDEDEAKHIVEEKLKPRKTELMKLFSITELKSLTGLFSP